MKRVAIICNYILRSDRIGGMDRFYKLFNQRLIEKGYEVDWYFTSYTVFEFYKDMNIYSANESSVEQFFLKKQQLKEKDIEVERLDAFQAKLDKEKANIIKTQSLIDVRT